MAAELDKDKDKDKDKDLDLSSPSASLNGRSTPTPKTFGPKTDAPPEPVFSPATARAAINKRRMSMQDSIDVSKIDRHMYSERTNSGSKPPTIIIENQDGEIQSPESVRSHSPEQPLLELSLQHDSETSILTVSVARATNLHPLVDDLNAQLTSINPYCKVQLMPTSSIKASKHVQVQTGKVLKNMWAPTFSEQFALSIERSELDTRTMLLSIYHDDYTKSAKHSTTSDFCLGHVLIPLANVKLQHLQQLRKEIKAGEAKDSRQPPIVLLGLAYLPTAERLTVSIAKVTNLLNNATKAVLVTVALLGEGNAQMSRKKTSLIKVSEQCADVNETFNFNLRKKPIDSIIVRVTVQQFKRLFLLRKRLETAVLKFSSSADADADANAKADDQATCEGAQHWQDMLAGKDSKTPRWHTMVVLQQAA